MTRLVGHHAGQSMSEGDHGNRNNGASDGCGEDRESGEISCLGREGRPPAGSGCDRIEVDDALVDTGATMLSMPNQ